MKTRLRLESNWFAGSWRSRTTTHGSGRQAHVDEWSAWLVAERHLAPSTLRSYQGMLRLFSEFLIDGRYGWVVACEEAFGRSRSRSARVEHRCAPEPARRQPGQPGLHPHRATAVPGLCRRAGRPGSQSGPEGRAGRVPGRDGLQGRVRVGITTHGDGETRPGRLGAKPRTPPSSAGTGRSACATARPNAANHHDGAPCCR